MSEDSTPFYTLCPTICVSGGCQFKSYVLNGLSSKFKTSFYNYMHMSLSLKGAMKNKIMEQEKINFHQRQNNLRSVLSPVENIRKRSQIPMKSAKTDISPSFQKSSFSTPGGNSNQKQKPLKSKLSSHGCVTILDFHKKENRLCPVSKVVPQKKLVFNSYHQQCHIARWKSWLADTPNWILDMGLENANANISQNVKSVDKENHYCENESANSSYVTIEDEVLEMSSNGTVEPEDEKSDIMDEENRKWRDWSIQLSDDGKLLITGKTDDEMHQAKDVTSCELVDSNTLKFRNGVIYELMGMPDHFTNLPYYIRNKFQCGFPNDWKTVKELWVKYIKEGSPFDFSWSTGINESPFNVTFDRTTSFEVPRNRSLIPVKSTANCDPVKKNPHSTQPSGSLEPFKQSYSLSVSEYGGSSVVKKNGDHLATEVLVEHTEKLDINKSPESSIASSAHTQMNQEIVLCNWTPMLVNGADIKIKGYIVGSQDPDAPHVTDVIEVRRSFDSFSCVGGGSYKLQGKFVDPENSIPDEIKKKLTKGLPRNWKLMIKNWCLQIKNSK